MAQKARVPGKTPLQSAGDPRPSQWPDIPYESWKDTCTTLHMWTQIVGKTRLELMPMLNHWWQVPLYLSARGLTTGLMPYDRARQLEIEFDFLNHELVARTTEGAERTLPLVARPVAEFYEAYLDLLAALSMPMHIWPMPVEIPDAIPFPEDTVHRSYDGAAAQRFWRALAQMTRVLVEFRGQFQGKSSPVHFFWGSFDLALTRFSGRPAPPHPGGAPNLGDWVMRESYSHEVSSVGFWPGSTAFPEAAFYSYAYPEPDGFSRAPVQPPQAYYHEELHEFVLPYDAVRNSPHPDSTLLDFAETTYEAAANAGHWDRPALERRLQPEEGSSA